MIAEANIERFESAKGRWYEMLTRTHVDVANDRYHEGGFSLFFIERNDWYVIRRYSNQNWAIYSGEPDGSMVMDLGTKRARAAVAKINLLFETR